MQQQSRLPRWYFAAMIGIWALIAGAFVLGVNFGMRHETPSALVAELPKEQLEALAIVHRAILKSHVDPQDGRALLENAIRLMVHDLDPYSRYVTPAEVPSYEEDNTGHYEGIGAEFGTHDDHVVLYYPLAGGPAERAGLRPGDLLLAIDGQPLDTPEQRARMAEFVRGASGSELRMRLERDGAPFEVTLARGDVQHPCVKWAHRIGANGEFGYVQLTDFHPGCASTLIAAIDALQQPQPLRGLVLDLRDNGGGSFDDCVAIARAFLHDGLICSETRRDSEIVERFDSKPEQCRFPDLPLVLLVNEQSASASEVLAGALQDNRRAAIVGQRTHGKAYVNTVYTWKNLPFRLKLTTGKYRTPSGRDIERHHHVAKSANADAGGIPPDVVVPLTASQRDAVTATLGASEPPAAWREAFAAVAAHWQLQVPSPPAAADDPQLAAALRTLAERAAERAAQHTAEPQTDRSASHRERDK
jgi:carboxyl-terminal processing protease